MSALKSHRHAYYQLQHAINQREIDYNHMSDFHAISMAKKSNTTRIEGGDPDHMDVETGLVIGNGPDYGTRAYAEMWAGAANQKTESELSDFPSSLGTAERFFNDGRDNPMDVQPAGLGYAFRPGASERLQMASNPTQAQFDQRSDISSVRRDNEARIQSNQAREYRQSPIDRNRRHRGDISDSSSDLYHPPTYDALADARRHYRIGMFARNAAAIVRERKREVRPNFGRASENKRHRGVEIRRVGSKRKEAKKHYAGRAVASRHRTSS